MIRRIFARDTLEEAEHAFNNLEIKIPFSIGYTIQILLEKHKEELGSAVDAVAVPRDFKHVVTGTQLAMLNLLVPSGRNFYYMALRDYISETQTLSVLRYFTQTPSTAYQYAEIKNYLLVRCQLEEQTPVSQPITFPDVREAAMLLIKAQYDIPGSNFDKSVQFLLTKVSSGVTQPQLAALFCTESTDLGFYLQTRFYYLMEKLLPFYVLDSTLPVTGPDALRMLSDIPQIQCLYDLCPTFCRAGLLCLGIQQYDYPIDGYIPRAEWLAFITLANNVFSLFGFGCHTNSHEVFYHYINNVYEHLCGLASSLAEFIKIIYYNGDSPHVHAFLYYCDGAFPDTKLITALGELIFGDPGFNTIEELQKEFDGFKAYVKEFAGSRLVKPHYTQAIAAVLNAHISNQNIAYFYRRLFTLYIELIMAGHEYRSIIEFFIALEQRPG